MSILKIILIGILCLAPEKDGWVRINGDNYISFSFPSRGERFKKEVNNMRSWIFQTKNITCVFGAVCTQLTKEKGVLDEYTINQLYISMKKESVSMPTAKTHRGEKDSRRGHGHPGNILHHHERRGRNDVFQTIYLPGQLHVPTHDRREN